MPLSANMWDMAWAITCMKIRRSPILAGLVPGMTIAIEPMVNQAGEGVRVLDNDWTVVTRSGSLSAHFEHTIAITEQGPMILTTP